MYSIGLTFEYSRIQLPSLSSGCEIAPFFVRYMGKDDDRMMCMSKSQEDDIMTLVSVEDHPIGSVKGACVRILFRG
jgi:hypothetical protein